MRCQWIVRRTMQPEPDGRRRWDRACQDVLSWTRVQAVASAGASRGPGAREDGHEGGALCPCICVFHVIAGVVSTASWAGIPREGGQRFHGIAGTWVQVPEPGLPTAAGFALGCEGLAFCRDRPSARTSLDMWPSW